MMADGSGPEHDNHSVPTNDLNVHIKQELDNGPCCSPSPSTMQSNSQSEKNFITTNLNNNNINKNCNVRH